MLQRNEKIVIKINRLYLFFMKLSSFADMHRIFSFSKKTIAI